MSVPVFLHDLGIVCALGRNKAEVWRRATAGDVSGVVTREGDSFPTGRVASDGVALSDAAWRHGSRNNRLLMEAIEQIRAPLEKARAQFGSHRIGVILGTSTSGIEESLRSLKYASVEGKARAGSHYHQQEIGSCSVLVAQTMGLDGPAYTVSTACTSSARVFASARRLISLGQVDAVLVGGGDSLATLTIAGFGSLESLSRKRCNPMSLHRDGLNIGEGAAVFLMTREPGGIELCGVGSCSDAHHMSAPDPTGSGAATAMRKALSDAGLTPADIDYVNLHGTATPLNDAMESKAFASVFEGLTPLPLASSTKPMTGHALGAAGAIELGLCWLALSSFNTEGLVPPHVWDEAVDPALPSLRLAQPATRVDPRVAMSNSFAFGGNNVSLIVRRRS